MGCVNEFVVSVEKLLWGEVLAVVADRIVRSGADIYSVVRKVGSLRFL